MTSPFQLAIRGAFLVVGKEPDGDSVRFKPDNPALLNQLRNSRLIRSSKQDGSVQLRFEGVDAAELHYGSAAQPLGSQARDNLLKWMGWKTITYVHQGSTMVKSAQPETRPGAILSQMAEANGRPVAYVLVGAEAEGLHDGEWTEVDKAILQRTLNVRLLDTGMAYYTVYTSAPAVQSEQLRQVALAAREAGRGVWSADCSSDFKLVDQASIGPIGQLILPKLFRRCTDFLKAQAQGFRGDLADWLVSVSVGSRNENDLVVIGDTPVRVPLSQLLEQRNDRISFTPDLLDITFVEKA
jgi:endonuclease YncB( thermonuclease family)